MLFTGSTNVGRAVMAAAAKNLTPVTLELGGKSPTIISRHISLNDAIASICYGKSFNAGQTCVAPDYVLVPKEHEQAFVEGYANYFAKMFPNLRDNPDYTAIINERQHQRLTEWVKDADEKGAYLTVLNPADEDLAGTRKFNPVLVQNQNDSMTVAQQELFGPVLSIVPYDTLDDALAYIEARPRPLALYYFGHNKAEQDYVLKRSHSGGVTINDTLVHFAQDDMPVGGVGESGMGHYHGKEGFLTFSKEKPVHIKGKLSFGKAVHPPYKENMISMIKKMFLR